MNYLLSKLAGGDLRSDGRADEVIKTILKDPELLTLLTEGLTEPDVVVRARTPILSRPFHEPTLS